MRIYLLFLLSLNSMLPAYGVAGNNTPIAVIASKDHSAKAVTKSELSLIFLRKKLYWSNGQRIHPVNLPADNSLRNQFSLQILGSTPESQTEYWNGLYYHGVSPPHVVHSSEAALRFVTETSGAIAYIEGCEVEGRSIAEKISIDKVKILAWLDENGHWITDANDLACPR